MASLAQINIKFSADLRQFSSEMQSALRDINRIGQDLQNVGNTMSIGFTLPILAAGAASVKMASDYEESLNKVNVAFGSSNESVKSFAQTTLDTYGIAEGTALDMAALFGDMATSMGLPQAEAANLSTSLVGLAGDLASFKNIGIDQAMTALNGVFTGETESLKLLGIVMTEANLAQFALTQGITKSVKEMSQAEKVQLRYAFVMEKTRNAQGDFARTSDGAANQTRVLRERFKEIGQQLGAIILPAFTELITGLNGALRGFQQLSPGVKTTIVVVAGLVAAIGPLLSAFGTLLTFVPVVVARFATLKASMIAFSSTTVSVGGVVAGLKTAFASLTATLLANPFTALIVGLTSVIAYLALTKKSLSDTVTAVNQNTESIIQQNKAAQDLGNNVEQLVNRYDELKAKSKLSKEEQQELSEVILKIGKVVPGAVTEVNKYGEALDINSKKARAFTDSQRELIALRTQKQLQENVTLLARLQKEQKALTISEDDLYSKYVEGIGYIRKRNGVLELYNRILSTSRALTLEELVAFKEKAVANEQNIATAKRNIDTLRGVNVEQKASVESTKELKTAVKELVTEREKLKPISLESSGSQNAITNIDAQIAKLRQFQNEATTTAQQWQLAQEQINNLEAVIQIRTEGVDSLIQADGAIKRIVSSAEIAKLATAEMNRSMSESFTQIAESAVENLAVGFGESIAAIIQGANVGKTIGEFLLKSIGQVMVQLGKAAIQIGITMDSIKASFATPGAAIAAGVGLVVLGTLIQSFVPDDFQRFQDGGIVGGNSFYGDKILARVNSGELILNQQQQKAVFGMMNGVSQNLNVGFQDVVIEGDKLRIILDRTDAKNNRKK